MKPQTQEEKNIAVAISLGWTFKWRTVDYIDKDHPFRDWTDPEGVNHGIMGPVYGDYCNDRNAIAGAVAAQDNFGFKLRYTAMLPLIIHGPSHTWKESERRLGSTIHLLSLIEATAEQRVDAYLAAL